MDVPEMAAVRDLGHSVADRLAAEQRRWLTEFVDAGEWGVALEMLADWLSEDECGVTPAERAQFRDLAAAWGIEDRVMRPLDDCPDR